MAVPDTAKRGRIRSTSGIAYRAHRTIAEISGDQRRSAEISGDRTSSSERQHCASKLRDIASGSNPRTMRQYPTARSTYDST
eukprot:2601886-Rhodomonas_salina.1